MPTASVALRAAIHDALAADGALTALLAGPKIYDEPPASAAFPYVTLGEARVTDYSTATEPGEEHQLTLHAWSRQGGHREAHLIAGALLQALDDAPLTLDDHRWSTCASRSPTSAARRTGAPITRWCGFAR